MIQIQTRKTTFIYQKEGIVTIAEKLIRVTGNVINNLSCIPLRMEQEFF